jgi:prophage regulatory protein
MPRTPTDARYEGTGAADMFERMKLDPGTRTVGELLQEREWAVFEIGRLQAKLLLAQSIGSHAAEKSGECTGDIRSDFRSQRFLRLPEICKLLGLSKTTIYVYKAAGHFPEPVKIGAASVRWRMEDIQAWQNSLSP